MVNVRKIGFTIFAAGLACGAVVATAAYSLDLLHWRAVLLAVAVPVAFSLAGLAQGIAGVPFSQMSSQWNSLQGWQRGVLGLLLVLACSAVIFSVILALIASGAL